MEQNIRWQQRFANYKKALYQLSEFIEKGELNKFERQGLLKAFEYTYELAWNVMKDFLEYQGDEGIRGSRDAIRMAMKRELIEDGEIWMKMVESRILSSHSYNEEVADDIAEKIIHSYFYCFEKFKEQMEELI